MSHLYTLIERVKRREINSDEEMHIKEKAINLAEYLTYSHDYSDEEAKGAMELLKRYEMDNLVNNPDGIEDFLTILYPSRTQYHRS